jgi:DNA-binding beta-propeller fold protein YncE
MLIGLTVAGYVNGTVGNGAMGLHSPTAVSVMPNGDLYVSDTGNNRVQYFPSGSSMGLTVAGNGIMGGSSTELYQPMGIYVDPLTRNVYVADNGNYRVQLWTINATQGQTVVYSLTGPIYPVGVRLNVQGTIYLSDWATFSILYSPLNSGYPILLAGSGSAGSDSGSFNNPYQIDLDASGEYLYVDDSGNHRIQQWQLLNNGTEAASTGVTIAGGNGQGNGTNQLNNPNGVCVSAQTGAIYIADTGNSRIQYWAVGASQGVTIAGPTQLNQPAGLTLDPNETYLYVADQYNNRIQRFTLI